MRLLIITIPIRPFLFRCLRPYIAAIGKPDGIRQRFTDSNILMVGKKEVAINSEYVVAEVPMERLVARLDIYMFKNQGLRVRVCSCQLHRICQSDT